MRKNLKKLLSGLLVTAMLSMSAPVPAYGAEDTDTFNTIAEPQDPVAEEQESFVQTTGEPLPVSVSGNEIPIQSTEAGETDPDHNLPKEESSETDWDGIPTESESEPEIIFDTIDDGIILDAAVYGDDYPSEYKNAALDSVIDRWNFYNRECTSFAAWCLNSRNGVSFTNWYGGTHWGHAKNWGQAAAGLGITVDMNPAKGSIYWSSKGIYGHVAWVSDVSNGNVTIEEYNYSGDGKYNSRVVAAGTASGYIHMKDLPDVILGSDMPDGGPQAIPDGNYHIITGLDGNMCLDIAGPSLENGGNAQIYHSTESDSQIFNVTYLGKDKGYKIIHNYSGKSLDVEGASKERGANVWQWEYYDPAEHTQQWVINEVDNAAYYTIQSRGSGFYLDVAGAETADCTNVQIWEGNGTNAQKWRFIPVGTQTVPDGDYHIVTDLDDNMCLGIQDASLENEANAQISHSTEDSRQIFTVTYLEGGFYKVIHKFSGKSLDVYGSFAERGTNVQQYNYHGGRSQQWVISADGPDTYTIRSKCSGHYLDVANGQTTENTNVWMTVGNGSSAQKWKFIPVSEEKLHTPAADIPSGTEVDPGTKVHLSCEKEAAIYYTLDGTRPTRQSRLYSDPILIEKDTLITAYAVKEGYADSDIITFIYTVPNISKPDSGDVLEEDIPHGNIEDIPQGLWMSAVASQTYTGKAIRPEVRVYDHKTLLTEKKDYTISYKNNIKVNNTAGTNTPTITVTGRGNYTGKEMQTFVIKPKSLADDDIAADDITLQYNGKMQKPLPAITWNGKKLIKNKDYTIDYPNEEEDSAANPSAYIRTGDYTILIKGIGNYTGEKTLNLTITQNKPMSKLNVTKIADLVYTGEEICPVPVVKDGNTILSAGRDFDISYQNNIKTGKASITLIGRGDYAGTKKINFKIVPKASLNKAQAKIEFNRDPVYTGEEIRPDRIILTVSAKNNNGEHSIMTLTEGIDYETVYQHNVEAGTAVITFKGINGYNGTLKKSYKIAASDIAANENFIVEAAEEYEYTKGGCRPEPIITFQGKALTKNTDYTLSYQNNAKINDGSDLRKQPAIIIKGKGNFKGSRKITYRIVPKNIGSLTLTADDRVWQDKGNIYQTKIVIQDINGKTLSAGKDYERDLIYEYGNTVTFPDGTVKEAGEKISAGDILPAGAVIRVTATAKGSNYTGTLSNTYRIAKADISKAAVTVPAQTYTGKAIEPNDEIIVKLNGRQLSKENYEIVKYDNNVNKGVAAVTIKGINDCGGTKTVKFQIKGKGLWWWWR